MSAAPSMYLDELAVLHALHLAHSGAKLAHRMAVANVERDPSPDRIALVDTAAKCTERTKGELFAAWVRYGAAVGLVEVAVVDDHA